MNAIKLFTILLLLAIQNVSAQTDSVIYIWPNTVPGETKPKSAPVYNTIADGSERMVEITNPFLAVFQPEASKKNGKAIIVCPGGGYVRLATEKEGYTVARWLMTQGYTVFVLAYRVPDKREGAWQDLQRSIKWVRHHAKKYEIDPNKVGAMGFSAGAHLAALLGMGDSTQRYPKQDAADEERLRPDCMVIIYPGYLSGGPNRTLSPELKATPQTPDTFIFQTMDDGSAPSSFALAKALQEAKANVELHMLPRGGHGYGMYPGNKAAETWPGLLEKWLKVHF